MRLPSILSAITLLAFIEPAFADPWTPVLQLFTLAPSIVDTDGDGMDDGWETTYFGNLSRNGTGDYDGDGLTDKEEHDHGFHPLVDDAFDDADGDRYPNLFEVRKATNPNSDASIPAPDRIVDLVNGNNSPTDNLYDDIQDAVAAAVSNGTAYQIIGLLAGVYTGTRNRSFNLYATQPRLLVIGLEGAAKTIIDGENQSGQFNLQRRSVIASLTIKNQNNSSPIYVYGSAASGTRLVDLVLTSNTGTTFNGAIYVYYNAQKVEVAGCSIFGNWSASANARAIRVASSAGVTVRSSIFWNPGVPSELYKDASSTAVANYSLVRGDVITGSNNVTPATDPLLRTDGRVRLGSPAIGAGSFAPHSKRDIDLELRPSSSADIGADEWVDTDADSLADAWELAITGSLSVLSSASQDLDADGLDNTSEYAVSTNPTIADTDGDALNDGAELAAGTNPLDADSDDDGMPDGYEVQQAFNPLADDAMDDADRDRYPNVIEWAKGTDPSSAASIPAPDRIVDVVNGNASGTDNIYDDLQDAVAAAVSAGTPYAVIGLVPGVYTGTRNRGFTVLASQPQLLVIGLEGAAKTIIDGEGLTGQFNLQRRTMLASLTIRRLSSNAPIYMYGSAASGSRLADLIVTNNSATTFNGAVYLTSSVKRVEVIGSTIFGNTGVSASSRAIYLASSSEITLRSSIVWNPGLPGELSKDASSTAVAHSSLVRLDAITGSNNVTPATDPLLRVDGRLRLGSPVIGLGTLASQSNRDMDLELRSGTPDIGADQRIDADGDTLADAWEIAEAGSLAVLTSGAQDPDQDGLGTQTEYELSTKPTLADTDVDGLSDGAEVAAGTDPLNPDSDADGMPDGYEVAEAFDPLTDDAFDDADGDRYPNVFEYIKGTDPNGLASIPSADRIVDVPNGNSSSTDNIYDDLQDAVAAAVASGSTHQIIGLVPGTYTGLRNRSFTLTSGQPHLLVIGLGGAAVTTIDGQNQSGQFNIQKRSVVASLTIKNQASSAPIYLYGAPASGSRIVDVIMTANSASTFNGAIRASSNVKEVEVVGSTIFGNSSAGGSSRAIYVSSSSEITLWSTIVWNPGLPGELYEDASSAAVANYSLVRLDAITGANNVTPATDPLLDANGRPQSTSPVIREGTRRQSRYDMDLELRPVTPDIGADQAASTPYFASSPPLEATIGQAYSYAPLLLHTYPEEPLTLTIETGPSGMAIVPIDAVSWTPSAMDLGPHSIVLRVTDTAGNFDEQIYVLTVYDGDGDNDPPFFASAPPTTAAAGVPYSYTPVVIDPDFGDAATIMMVAHPSGMSLASGTVQWTPASGQWGAHSVVLRATDQYGAYDLQPYSIAVGGQAPSFTSSPVTQGALGAAYSYDAAASDPDAGDTLSFSLADGPPGMGIAPSTGLVSWVASSAGTHPVDLMVTDAMGLFAHQTYAITVPEPPPNNPPVFMSAPPSEAVVGQLFTYDADATDADQDPLTYALLSGPSGMAIDAGGFVTWTPAPGDVGSVAVTISVSDGRGGSASQGFVLQVYPFRPPRAGIGLAIPRNVARAADGATVIALSSELPTNPAIAALDDTEGNDWQQSGWTDHFVRIDLAGGSSWIDRIVIELEPCGFETDYELDVRASASPDPGSFISVVAGNTRLSPLGVVTGGRIFERRFQPFLASHVEVWIERPVPIRRIEVWTPASDGGGIASLFESGASVANVSNDAAGSALAALDAPSGSLWGALGAFPHHLTVELAEPALVDRASIHVGATADEPQNDPTLFNIAQTLAPNDQATFYADWWRAGPKDIAISVSDSAAGPFTQVYSGSLPRAFGDRAPELWVAFEPALASFVRIDIADNHGFPAAALVVDAFRVYGPASGGKHVALSAKAIPGDAPIAGVEWDFGNGEGSTELEPIRDLSAGTHPITLAVTDTNGLIAIASIDYAAFAAPPVSVTANPAERHTGGGNVILTDATSYGSSVPVARRWNGSWKCSSPTLDPNASQESIAHSYLQNCPWTPSESETAFVGLEAIDDRLLRTSLVSPYYWALNHCTGTLPYRPAFTTEAKRIALAGAPYSYDANAVDGDPGQALTYALDAGPAGLAIDPSTGVVTWATAEVNAGVHTVTIRATDPTSLSGTQTFRLNLRPAPGYPQIFSQPSLAAVEGQLYTYWIDARDPDRDDILSFIPTSVPSGVTIDAKGLLTWTPAHAENGPNPFLIEVRDSTGHAITHSFTVTVDPVNAAPAFASMPPVQAFEGQLYSAQLDTTDDVPGVLTHALIAGPAGMSVSAAGAMTWTPSAGQLGPNPVSVSVTDSEGASTTLDFTIAVFDTDGTNDPPVIASAAVTQATERAPYTYDAQGFDPDQGDTITWSVIGGPPGLAVNAASGLVSFTPSATQVGSHPVTLRLTDAASTFAEQSFTLEVAANPEPPAFTSTPILITAAALPYSYAPAAQDPNLDPVDFLLLSGPSGMVFDAQDILRWTPAVAQTGSHPVVIAARDPGGLQSAQSFTLTVRNYTTPPAFTTPPAQAASYVGETYRHTVAATDADPNDAVTLTVATGLSGLTYSAAAGEVAWTPQSTQVPEQSFVLRAQDLGLNATLQASTVPVRAFSPPEFTSVPPVNARPDELYRYAISTMDPDNGDPVQVSLQSGPPGLGLVAGPALEWTPTLANLGSHPIVLEARDERGARTTQAFTLVVQVNQAPAFTSSPPTALEAGSTYGHQVAVQDDGPSPLNVALVEGPAGMTLSSSNILSWPTHFGDEGRHPIVVRATDGLGLASDLAFELVVRPPESNPQVPANTYCNPVASWNAAWSQIELEMLAIVNQVRSEGADCGSRGYFEPPAPLVLEPTLRCAARVHAEDMFVRDFFDHINPDGQGPGVRATLAGYPSPVGENLAQGSPVASEIIDWLLGSDGHCANMLDPITEAIGVGYHPGGGAQVDLYVQVFGTEATGNRPPVFAIGAPKAILIDDRLVFHASATDPEGEVVTHSLVVGPAGLTIDAPSGLIEWHPSVMDLGQHTFTVQATDASGASAYRTYPIMVLPRVLPPDPSAIAPALSKTEIPSFFDQVAFLWTSNPAVQLGVDTSILDVDAIAVVRGLVRAREGAPLSGVRVRAAHRPELGFTLTRADGRYDLAVLGGGQVVLEYELAGYIPAERTLDVPWSDYAEVSDVALVPYDAIATQVAFGAGSMQVAQGSTSLDTDGARRATVFFPAGTQANLVLPNGATQPITSGSIRATELTVGPDGPDAMPAELPLGTGYTYAVELSVDEAIAAGATGVQFSQPVPLYVDNFLGFPVGGQVPIGYYDRNLSTWVPEDDGRIIEILSVTGGLADLDVDGTGTPASPAVLASLAITVEEQQQLAQLYAVGDELWRVGLPHFSAADVNWPMYSACLGDCTIPRITPRFETKIEDDCERSGSIIECQNQTLGESLGVTGTGMTLDYRSDRVPGRQSAYTIEVPIGAVPSDALAIRIEIIVAGRTNEVVLPPSSNQTYTHVWDGRDAYGRIVLGKRRARVRIAYDYPSRFTATRDQVRTFGLPGKEYLGAQIELRSGRRDLSVWRASVIGEVGTFDARAAGLGGWTLSAHHLFDPVSSTVYFGDGTERKVPSRSRAPLDELTFGGPRHISADAKGRLYIADAGSNVVWRIDPETGAAVILAGTAAPGFSGDGGPAAMAQLYAPNGVAVDALGNVYVADTLNHRIRRIRRDGVIETVAGTGQAGFDGDVGVAPLAKFNEPRAIDVGPDGSLYVADFKNNRIRRIRPGATPSGFGMVVTAVGGTPPIATGPPTQGLYALRALLGDVHDLAVDHRGDLYFVIGGWSAVYRVRDDRIDELAGCETSQGVGSGGSCEYDPAVPLDGIDDAYRLWVNPWGLSLDGDDVLLADAEYNRVWRVTPDGRAHHVAGGGLPSWSGYGPRTTPLVLDCATDVVMGPDQAMYITDGCGGGFAGHLRVVGSPHPPGNVDVVSQDGSAIFRFTETGRHIATIDTVTAQTLLTFGYASGYLTSIADAHGNTTSIVRGANSVPEKIVAPFGQETLMFLDANNYLAEARDPSLASYRYGYTPMGLMDLFTDPMNTPGGKQYANGRLTRDDDGGGGFQTLARTPTADGYRVDRTTAMGRTTRFEIEQKPGGTSVRTVLSSNGVLSTGETKSDGTVEKIAPNGVRTTAQEGPSPRFGMEAPMVVEATTEMPSGLRMVVEQTATAVLSEPKNPLTLTWSQSTVSVNGRTSTTTYDAATRTVTTVSPAGRTTETVLDAFGRAIETRVPGLFPVFGHYDIRGRPDETQQGTRITTTRFRLDGYVDELEDAMNRITKLTPDAVGRPIAVQGPDGRTTAFDYDLNGNNLTLTPPFRPGHEFVYDPRNLETEYRPPLLAGMSMPTIREYNLDQDPTLVTLPDGRQIGMVYLPNGVLDRVTTPDGDIAFAYDAVTGEIQSISAPSGVVTSYARDGDLVTDVIYSGLISASVHHEHDDNLRVIRQDVNGGSSVPFAYDADGIATQVGAMTLVPRADNGLLDSTQVGIVSDAYGWSGYGELATYAASVSGTPIYERTDDRDDLARMYRTTETVGGTTDVFDYVYDLASRIDEVRRNGILEANYGYDGNDNRISVTDLSGTRTATIDDQDRLLAFGDYTYVYNDTGQLATKTRISTGEITNYAYDVKTNLLTADRLGGDRIDYAVDALDQRVARFVNGLLDQTYIWAGGSIVASVDAGVFTRYVYGTAGVAPDYFARGASTYRILKDSRGSVRFVVDAATGAIAQRIDYGPFGEVLLDTNPGFQPFAYAGGLYDPATGLVRFGARDYDAYAGRWTAKDPGGFQETGSLYAYASNDPINQIDPNGQLAFLVTLGIGAIVDAGLEIGFQLLANGGRLSCIDWGDVAKEVAIGAAANAAGVGLLKKGAKFNKLRKAAKVACKLCLSPDTLVETVDGLVPIEEIEVGDLVLAMDEATGDQAYKPVLEVIVTPNRPLIELAIHTDDRTETLRVTPDHPFWVQGIGWVDAGELEADATVYSFGSGWVRIAGATRIQGEHTVYNLTVGDYSTFAVGEGRAWVHNCNGNAKRARRAQHGYEIVDTRTGEVVKTGVSGGKRTADGGSYRANRQVNKWNREVGEAGRYEAQVVEEVSAGHNARKEILEWEAKNADDLRAAGHLTDLERHVRP